MYFCESIEHFDKCICMIYEKFSNLSLQIGQTDFIFTEQSLFLNYAAGLVYIYDKCEKIEMNFVLCVMILCNVAEVPKFLINVQSFFQILPHSRLPAYADFGFTEMN